MKLWIRSSQVYRCNWWMWSYGSGSPKRHVAYSNSPAVKGLWRGKLKGWRAKSNQTTKPCRPDFAVSHPASAMAFTFNFELSPGRSYVSKAGVRRFQGTKFLKSTEPLGPVTRFCLKMITHMRVDVA